MKIVSKEQWHSTHKDFKCTIKGKPHMVYLDKKTQATSLGPVEIFDTDLNTEIELTKMFLEEFK